MSHERKPQAISQPSPSAAKLSTRKGDQRVKYPRAVSTSPINLSTVADSAANDFRRPSTHRKSVVLRGDCSGMDFTAMAPPGDKSSVSHCPVVESEVTRFQPCGEINHA